ncbi:FKBP-type peptidyl-prolyl cis-trans isomerase [Haloarcula sp. GH36]|uniref:FKBP-type peptidyl-prolyl cis-trans isomerase n=1 Tax=Haloarcula montana TaxID=3111776 RepID=UPI002D78F1A7|nr:FKBP-type peptidyl-prolyl cis-trans isomerase [Haloarcula sp. GH36]
MTIEAGDGVTVEYVGRFEDGTIFDTSRYEVAAEHGLAEAQDADPDSYKALSFRVGNRDVIAGLDDALVGLSEGEEATITVDPENAYGPVEAEKIREYDPATFEAMVGAEPEVGMHVHAENDLHGDVTAIRDDSVEVDFNHELAGKTLVFEIEVLDVWG